MLARSLVILALLAACGDRRPPVTAIPPGGADGGPTEAATDAGGGGGTPAVILALPVDTSAHVAPHAAQIVATALDRTATAAVTIDMIGDVRLWRSLDGKQPPIALPFHGALALEVALDGASFVVGRIDPAGAPQFFRLDRDGKLIATGAAPAVPQAIGLVAVTGTAWLVVRADHSVMLVDDHGTQLDEIAHAATRIEALRPFGADGTIAVVSHDAGNEATFGAVKLTIAKGKIGWGAELALPVAPLAPVEAAASPDGKRLAYFADPTAIAAAAKAAAAAAQAPRDPKAERAARRPGGRGPSASARAPRQLPDPPAAALVVDLATGADVTPKDLAAAPISVAQRLGFSSNDTLRIYGAGSGDIAIGLDADAEAVAGTLPRSSAPAIGPGLTASGYDRNLLVQRDGGETRYLGYRVSAPALAALSPDGTRAAWATNDGQIVVETLDGSAPEVHLPSDPAAGGLVALHLLDGDRLFAVTQRGDLSLYDAVHGTKVSPSMTAPGASYAVQYNPRSGWVVGIRDGGGVWALTLTPDADDPWTAAKVIADGSTQFWLLDAATPDEIALVTVDGSGDARRYTRAQLAAGVPASKVGKIAKVRLGQVPSYVDPTGRPYLFGADIRVAAKLGDDANTVLAVAQPRDIVMSPDGRTLVAFDQVMSAFALTSDGKEQWSLGVGSAGWRPAFSADGRRVALVSASGGQVVDVATGTVVAARCGWEFGAFPSAPPGFSTQVHPICE